MTQRYFAIINPGLEEPLLDEVRAIGGKKPKVLHGGVEFDATHKKFYRANLEFRCTNKIVLRVDEFRARDLPELYNKTRRFGWERLLSDDNRVFVRATSSKSRLMHTGSIAESVKAGLEEHFTDDLQVKSPEVRLERGAGAIEVHARIHDDRCQFNLDASGTPHYRRGWRQHIGDAPLRETVAAAALRVLDWEPGEPIYDPFCGSGTFVIEAARRAVGVPPGVDREFAFWRWANYRPELWEEVVEEARARMTTPEPHFFGTDVDDDAVAAARHNAGLADVEPLCGFRAADVADVTPPVDTPGLVVANPPYGERLQEDGVINRWLDVFAKRFEGWRLGLILPRELELRHPAIEFERRAEFKNGGIPVALWGGRFHHKGAKV